MFKSLILSLVCLATLTFAGPVEYLEVMHMTDLNKVSEVPENCQISLVINIVTIKGKPIIANGLYAGKIYADHIKWSQMGDLTIDAVYFSKDTAGAVWCTIFTPNIIFALRDVLEPNIRKSGRYVFTTLNLATGAQMYMLLQ